MTSTEPSSRTSSRAGGSLLTLLLSLGICLLWYRSSLPESVISLARVDDNPIGMLPVSTPASAIHGRWATSLSAALSGICSYRKRVGYAAGDELVPYLAWRDAPVSAARRVGLLRADGRERVAGRIVFPEIRQRQPVWLIGRLLEPAKDLPRHLGLPGPKPLLGWD